MQTRAAHASLCVGCEKLPFLLQLPICIDSKSGDKANSLSSSIVANDRVLPHPSLGKVEATQAVKLKSVFVALSARGFHQRGWLLSDELWEQS